MAQPIRAKLVVVHQEGTVGRSELWQPLTSGAYHYHELPSMGHLDFLKMPYVEQWMRLFLSHRSAGEPAGLR